MMDPLPNCFSICEMACSTALSLSMCSAMFLPPPRRKVPKMPKVH
jgi:hypothetical protein